MIVNNNSNNNLFNAYVCTKCIYSNEILLSSSKKFSSFLFTYLIICVSYTYVRYLYMLWTECIPLKFRCWSPNYQCNCLWRWSLWEVVKVRLGHEGGILVETGDLFFFPHQSTKGRIHKDVRGRQASANQEEGTYQTPNLWAPWFWAFQPRKWWEINS